MNIYPRSNDKTNRASQPVMPPRLRDNTPLGVKISSCDFEDEAKPQNIKAPNVNIHSFIIRFVTFILEGRVGCL